MDAEDEKLGQMSLAQTGGAAGWLVGAHRQVAAPKDAVTRATSKTSHTQHLGFLCFSSQNHKVKRILKGNYLDPKLRIKLSRLEQRLKCRMLPSRW